MSAKPASRGAAKKMPRPVPWEWARPRIAPLLAGPSFDGEIVRTMAGPGCAVEFGIDLGGVFARVDTPVAERWECSPDQLLATGLANLRGRLARIGPADVATGSFSGRLVRRLTLPRHCAASIVLLTEELVRLFGEHDQVFGVPTREKLVSFRIDTPPRIIAQSIVEMEMNEPLPLLYEPFVLLDSRLHWQADDDDPRYAELARDWPAA